MLIKFATQLEEQTLKQLREAARAQGRQVQALVGEAVKSYLEKQRQGQVRPAVLHALEKSSGEFGGVYNALIGKL